MASYKLETSRIERFTYGLFFGGQNILYIMTQMLIQLFYVTYLQIDPAIVVLIILVTRVFDAVNDPLIGVFMDKLKLTKTKYKTYINFSAFALPIATFFIFLVPQDISLTLKIILVILTYIIWDVCYTIADVPIFAISTVMAKSEKERTLLLAISRLGVIGVLPAMALISIVQAGGNDNLPWIPLAAVLSLMSFVCMLPQKWFIKERYNIEVNKKGLSFKQIFKALIKNDQLLIIMFLFLSQLFVNATSSFSAYVAEGYYGVPNLGSISSLLTIFLILPLSILAPVTIRKIGKKKFMYIGSIFTVIGGILIYNLNPDIGYYAIPAMTILAIGTLIPSILRGMFTADCIEYGENKTNTRLESTSFSIQTFFNKLADALGISLGVWLLSIANFNEQLSISANEFEVFSTLHKFSAILPICMGIIYLIGITFFYKLDEKKVQMYINQKIKI